MTADAVLTKQEPVIYEFPSYWGPVSANENGPDNPNTSYTYNEHVNAPWPTDAADQALLDDNVSYFDMYIGGAEAAYTPTWYLDDQYGSAGFISESKFYTAKLFTGPGGKLQGLVYMNFVATCHLSSVHI